MKHMKIAALVMAATMVLSPMSALASELEIGGSTNYVDTTVYKLTLPTSEGMSFTLDPQGLTALEDGEIGDEDKGVIKGTTLVAKNESSVDVQLAAKYYIVASTNADEDDNNDVTLGSSISDETEREIALSITADDTSTTKTFVTGESSDAATTATYTMEGAEYEHVKKDDGYAYEIKEGETGSTLNLTIGGNVAKEANWSDYADNATIKLYAIFTFKDATGTTEIEVKEEVTDREPSISATATYSTSAKKGTLTVDLGAGNSATTVSKVYYGGKVSDQPNELTGYTVEDGTLEYTLASWDSQPGTTKYLKVELANGDSQVVTVTVQ